MPNALAVVAHYDDHLLWMGATIKRMASKGWNWTLVAMCIEAKAIAKKNYFERLCIQLRVGGISRPFLDYQVGKKFERNKRDEMETALLNAVQGETFDWVFTHCRKDGGEYGCGHTNHSEVLDIVRSLVEQNQLGRGKSSLAYFSYQAIPGHTAATARFDEAEKTHYLQLTYEELDWKRIWCVETLPFDPSLPAMGCPCPNPEAFEGDGLQLLRPIA